MLNSLENQTLLTFKSKGIGLATSSFSEVQECAGLTCKYAVEHWHQTLIEELRATPTQDAVELILFVLSEAGFNTDFIRKRTSLLNHRLLSRPDAEQREYGIPLCEERANGRLPSKKGNPCALIGLKC